jgi:hypothetical protein
MLGMVLNHVHRGYFAIIYYKNKLNHKIITICLSILYGTEKEGRKWGITQGETAETI